ncbi:MULTISPECIES: cardiolipin synthase [Methanoculleus]|uniref:Cardiolipin synthetase 2 n=2 Tax=Methanoculleus TaxID=45989 RepID=A3CYB2_METMJ|nr:MULTISPECIES: cardiolipin synthase [Methanoculleus]ABN58362.1 cardiolipin synthetase 2 [Methanoculleus marisnigri JR1]MCC7554603.1 cardiolipin synthase [Methanoculleus marisnigri]UYU17362.1 cardiolipin synthase [Methanoculleus submarinus]
MELLLSIGFILALNVVFAVTIVFFERRNPTATTAWLVVLFLLPPVGFALYLFFGQNYTRQRMFVVKEHEDRCFLQGVFERQHRALAGNHHRFATPAAEEFRDAIFLLLRNNRAYLTEGNRVDVYTRGEDKFDALFAAIRGARHSIHLEYFVINDDELGRAVVRALAEKAREGVEVRLLFDAMGSRAGGGSRKAFFELEDVGGKIGVFFPSVYRINYRNHRKIAVIDGTVGFIGGFNIGDDYLGKGPLGCWRDTAVRITGEAVRMLQLRFFLDWNYVTGEYPGIETCYFPQESTPGATPVQIVSGGPDTRWNPIKEGYLKLINSARESICIQTPYFIPDESVADALRLAALSGVDVRIMIPCKPDHPFVYWATLSFIGDLLDAGVRAYTYDGGFLHAKTIVVDGKAGSVGSANWDVRSFRLNFEANAFFYDAAVGADLVRAFEEDLAVCTEITPENYLARSLAVRVKESVSRLFSPLG